MSENYEDFFDDDGIFDDHAFAAALGATPLSLSDDGPSPRGQVRRRPPRNVVLSKPGSSQALQSTMFVDLDSGEVVHLSEDANEALKERRTKKLAKRLAKQQGLRFAARFLHRRRRHPSTRFVVKRTLRVARRRPCRPRPRRSHRSNTTRARAAPGDDGGAEGPPSRRAEESPALLGAQTTRWTSRGWTKRHRRGPAASSASVATCPSTRATAAPSLLDKEGRSPRWRVIGSADLSLAGGEP